MKTNKATRYTERGYVYYDRLNENGSLYERDLVTSRRFTSWASSNNRVHTALQGETFRFLSRNYYGREDYWWIIADVNTNIEVEKGAFGLDAGTLVEVPPRSFLP